MKIEVLYIPGCPHFRPTVEHIRKVLASESVMDEVREVAVNTEDETKLLEFPGSPTVRINGSDIEPDRAVTAVFGCRLYAKGAGVPSEDLLRSAISQAKRRD